MPVLTNWHTKKKTNKQTITSFANPKSASFTDPLASTNILAHLISLEDHKKHKDRNDLVPSKRQNPPELIKERLWQNHPYSSRREFVKKSYRYVEMSCAQAPS